MKNILKESVTYLTKQRSMQEERYRNNEGEKRKYCRVKAKLSEMETDIRKFKNEREKMKESLLDLKCRSMKYNLVFTGLKETPYYNTEQKLRGFLGQELGIEHWIEFGNVHRFGQRNPENENISEKRLSDPQTESRLLDLSQGFGICP